MKVWLSAGALALGVASAAAEPSPIGQWGVTKPGRMFIACDTLDSLSRYNELISSGDASAATNFMSDHCRWFKSMTEVLVEHGVWTGQLCVRPRGDTACVWVQGDAVEVGADAERDKAAKAAEDAQNKADADKLTAASKALDERVDKAFDRAHPECKAWGTNKHLPDYCY
jgi:hypothetical protein